MESKQIPLVIYKSGTRNVVGMAIVAEDGSITAQVAKDHVKDVREYFYPTLDNLSLNPKP